MFLLHGMELLQRAQNENKVALAVVHQLKMSVLLSDTEANAHLLLDTEANTHTRLTLTEEPNSDHLFHQRMPEV